MDTCAILLTHTPEWSEIVGPFTTEAQALQWLREHTIILEGSDFKILKCEVPA